MGYFFTKTRGGVSFGASLLECFWAFQHGVLQVRTLALGDPCPRSFPISYQTGKINGLRRTLGLVPVYGCELLASATRSFNKLICCMTYTALSPRF